MDLKEKINEQGKDIIIIPRDKELAEKERSKI